MSKQLLSIRELEARNASEPIFGKGITVASGFDLGAKSPLDSRSIARTIADRDAHVTGNRAYEGMLVYVEEDQKTYQLINNQWKEFGFNEEQFQTGIVDSLDSTATDKALSANQGKVLNEKITTVEGSLASLETEVDELDARITQDIADSLNSAKAYTDEKVTELKSKLTSPEEGQALDVKFNNVVVAGNLEVKGSVKSIERTELHVEDAIIEVNSAGSDVATSDVHLGLRANLGNDNFSEIVYCPDSQKWVVIDTHPVIQSRHGEGSLTKTIAFVEDIEATSSDLQEKVNTVSEKVDTLEGEIDSLKAVENVTEKIALPSSTMNLVKTPFNDKVVLYVNGLLYVDGFTVAGNVITWESTDFEIEADDVVIAKYVVK